MNNFIGFVMHFASKSSSMELDDFYNDECNIDDMEEKMVVPDEILSLLENKDDETSILIRNGQNH